MGRPTSDERDLVHAMNNLLGVIHVQVAVARVAGTHEAASQALQLIEQAAGRAQQAMAAVRRQRRATGGDVTPPEEPPA